MQRERRSPDAAVRVERALRVLVVLEVHDAAVRRHVRPLAGDVEVRVLGGMLLQVPSCGGGPTGKNTPELHSCAVPMAEL